MGDKRVEEVCSDEIDIVELFRILWRRRKLIVWGTVIFSFLSLLIIYFMPVKYLGETELILPDNRNKIVFSEDHEYNLEISPQLFKNVILRSFNRRDVMEFYKGNREIELKNTFSLEPLYLYDTKDVRVWRRKGLGVSNVLVGIKLSVDGKDKESIKNEIVLLRYYLRNVLVSSKIEEFLYTKSFYLGKEYNKYREEIKELEEKIKFLESFKSSFKSKSRYKEFELYSIENELLKAKIMLSIKKGEVSEHECFFKFMELYEKEFDKAIFSFKDIEEFINEAEPDCGERVYIKNLKNNLLEELNRIEEAMKKMKFSEIKISIKTNKKLLAVVSIFFIILFFIFLAFVVEWWEKQRNLR